MISKLKGILDSTGPNWACIDVHGVFYNVFCSARTLDDILNGEGAGYGSEVKLITEMVVREDMMALYGFSKEYEHQWFQILISVQGVGMKVALAILSAASPEQMHAAILSGDKTIFTAADGVGPKLGTRLVNELKDKVVKQFGSVAQSTMTGSGAASAAGANLRVVGGAGVSTAFNEAASALSNLGYKPFEINQVLAKLQGTNPDAKVEELVPLALQTLSRAARS